MSFTWIPFYTELADKLVAWRDRQPELIAVLSELAEQKVPMVSLQDKVGRKKRRLDAIDPFTFFAAFNRGVRDDNRQAILAHVKERFGVEADVPVDFDGIPVVDNMQSWFFPYTKDRGDDDIPGLWDLFVQAVRGDESSVDGAVFDRCLQVKSVGPGKLTMGLFWVKPRSFLPVDRRTRQYVDSHGVEAPAVTDWTSYQALSAAVRQKLGSDFPAISLAAYLDKPPEPPTRRYWAGGHQFGEGSQLQRFKDTRRWEIGWPKGADSKGAKGAWERIVKIKPGDLFAIKGFGGRNNLRIHVVGRVVSVDAQGGKLAYDPIDQEHFRGKAPGAPGDGTWFETLVEVSNPNAVAAIFGSGTSKPPARTPDLPRNLILYGPPGTGKTWELLRKIRPLFDLDPSVPVEVGPDVAGLTWFHVIALALDELGPCHVPVLQEHPLIQAKYAERGVQTRLGPILWGQLQGHTVESSETVNYSKRSGLLVFDRLPDGRWHMPGGLPEEFRLLVDEEPAAAPGGDAENQFFVTFHPSFTYEDFVEGLRPEADAEDESIVRYPMRPGVFKQACERAVQLAGFSSGLDAFCRLGGDERAVLLDGAPPVVMFIDEINRGNVARILGELITLLEPDKRLGGDNEIVVTLPGSQRRFGVPSNLWVIGTMNTADRSIVALDTALRRRFAFRECPPLPELLHGVEVDGVDIENLIRTMNNRLERLLDRDHLIGHAFFMAMRTDPKRANIVELRRVFSEAILPLLQEFFYDDLGRIGLVLGPKFVQPGQGGSVTFAKGFEHDQVDDLADQATWRLNPIESLDVAAFKAIYA